jgi:hypothetical protein
MSFIMPKGPNPAAIRAEAEARAQAERTQAERKSFAETQAKMRAQQGRAATLLTDARTILNKQSLLG